MKTFLGYLEETHKTAFDAKQTMKDIQKINPKNRLKSVSKAREVLAKDERSKHKKLKDTVKRSQIPVKPNAFGTSDGGKIDALKRKSQRLNQKLKSAEKGQNLNSSDRVKISNELQRIKSQLSSLKRK